MTNEIQVFQNDRFGTIRALSVDGEPWFVAKDILDKLELDRTAMRKLDEDEKGVDTIHTLGGDQQVSTVSEPGLYKLVMRSRKPEAKSFQRWVTHEVLPAIRRTGGYMVARDETPEQTMARALLIARDTMDRQRREIDELRPKALFADAVAASDKTMLIGEFAKVLRQNGVPMGQNRLFQWMRDNGYLISRKGSSYNLPTQRSMELGLFRVKETAVTHSDGHVTTSLTTKLLPRGQQYFVNKFIGGGGVDKDVPR